MNNRTYTRRQQKKYNHYLLWQSKRAVEKEILLKKIAANGFSSDILRTSTPGQIFTLALMFSIFLLPRTTAKKTTSNNFVCTSIDTCSVEVGGTTVNIRIPAEGMVTDRAQCEYLPDLLKDIQTQLPDSTNTITNILKQPHIKFVCVSPDILFHGYGSRALFTPVKNIIVYPALDDESEKTDLMVTLHHEFIHAETSNRHRTAHCRRENFPEKELNLIKQSVFKTPNTEAFNGIITITPVWPPTKENLNELHQLIKKDFYGEKLETLRRLNIKAYEKKLSVTEKALYEHYSALLKGSLGFEDTATAVLSVETILESTLQTFQLPQNAIDRKNGIVIKNIKVKDSLKEIDGYPMGVEGTLTNVVSFFLYNCLETKRVIDEHLKQNNLPVAMAEFDATLRQGLPDAAVKEFFPNLWEQIQRDIDCCVEGKITRCKI